MPYHVITKRHQKKGRWITVWLVEVLEGDRKAVYHFGGRLCLKRYLAKLDQKMAAETAARQTKAKATAATLKKRHYHTWWGARVDRKTGQVKLSKEGTAGSVVP